MSNPLINLDPAKSVIDKIGGVEKAAAVTGKHISRIYRWMYSTTRGGTGGFVPHTDAVKLLDHAKKHDLPLAAEDFIQSPAPAEKADVA
jgi:hypothetical protein